ncbi:hypothetical protein P154DRAFT_263205 [Amniculicola lignicola CBS 123094]|uniref:TauD/TfdA-like domain-containing protein n=1 Tax=Amniculicola lignicola CBS 123094 TaxID=1392246 RepID=A0A6A5WKD6_9PLEO|nr:hypothetical protein P154DRAFT_263205 [Amniculicola lignicola CBS 123094]
MVVGCDWVEVMHSFSLIMQPASRVSTTERMSFTSESNQGVSLNLNGNTYVFHSQWLKDACFENESSRDAASVYVHRQEPIVITSAKVQGEGSNSRLSVTWKDGSTNNFPIPWLLALAPLVGKQVNPSPSPTTPKTSIPPGWLAKQVDIQELPYDKLIASDISPAEYASTQNWLLDTLLSPACPGILKVTNLPPVDPLIESSQKDNLLTVLLKHLFGAVFQHSKRGPDETFKIASYYKDKITSRIEELPNYDVSEILLPHVDHAHYDNPVRVQGLHSIQGESENTFIDGWAVLQTLKDEDPEAYEILGKSPMVLGRVAQFYDPPLFQTTVDTAIRPTPGFPNLPKAVSTMLLGGRSVSSRKSCGEIRINSRSTSSQETCICGTTLGCCTDGRRFSRPRGWRWDRPLLSRWLVTRIAR